MKKQIVLAILAVVLVSCGWLQAATPTWSDADINKDGKVDALDLAWLSQYWLVNSTYPNEFAYIPAGTFEMGDHHDAMSSALPVHTVTLDSFYMSKYEITNQQYCDYLNSAYPAQIEVSGGYVVNDSYLYCETLPSIFYCETLPPGFYSQIVFSDSNFSVNIKDCTTNMSNHPMVTVTWYGAVAYCNWKSQQEGLESCYDLSTWQCDFTKNGYRLPTEAEWEYAARGGNHSPYYRFPWGDSIDGSMANYLMSGDPYDMDMPTFLSTTPVGYYDGGQTPAGTDMANGYGLYDMAGNVYEWCNDWHSSTYYQECDDIGTVYNPTGPASGSDRILHGGGWSSNPFSYLRIAYRVSIPPDTLQKHRGFRVCVFASH